MNDVKKRLQVGTVITVLLLLVSSFVYILFTLPSFSDSMKDTIDSDSFYQYGTIMQAWEEECPTAVSDAPVQADVDEMGSCLMAEVLIQGYGPHVAMAPYGTNLDDVSPGVRVVMVNYDNGESNDWFMVGVDKSYPIIISVLLCLLIIFMVTKFKGFKAVLGIGISLAMIMFYVIPAILSGHSSTFVTLATSILILGLIMYLTHGISWMTTSAFLGTACGLGIILVLAYIFNLTARTHTALPDDLVEFIRFLPQEPGLIDSLSNLYFAGLILVGVGILNDVMIAQASTVWTLQKNSQSIMSPAELFKESMSVGRDHISSAMYTLVFVYASTALPLLLTSYVYMNMSWIALLSSEFGIEILRTGICITGLMIATPLTTYIAAFMSTFVPKESLDKHSHSH